MSRGIVVISKSGLIPAPMMPVSLQDLVKSSKNPKGYVRVSTDDQNPDLQFAALAALGLKRNQILFDQESGTNSKRPGYQKICRYINEGTMDLLVVNRLDRLGRDHYELLSFFQLLEKGSKYPFFYPCHLASICEPFVLHWRESSWAFRATWEAIGDARYELLRLKERQRAGIDTKQDLVRKGLTTWNGRGPDKKPRKK